MKQIIAISQSHEIIKKIKKNQFSKENFFVVDDLFALSLPEAKNCDIEYVIVCDSLIFSKEAKEIRDYYIEHAKYCFSVSEKIYTSFCEKENCAGITVVMKKTTVNLDHALEHSSFVLVNDGIEQSGNLGTIFRTCDAVGVDLVIGTNVKASVYQPKVLHASRGMVLKIPFIECDSRQAIQNLLDHGYTIYLCEPEDGVSFEKATYQGKVAIVIGCERFGISKEWFSYPHQNIKIEMYGTMTSLNVGVAGSIILYQARIQRDKE